MNSLWVQWAWTCLLCLSGSYGQLLDYVIFAVLVFYILTIVGLFVLRRTRPDAVRPYRAFGYPVLPGLYIVMAAVDLCCTIAVQTSVHVAGPDDCSAGYSGVPGVDADGRCSKARVGNSFSLRKWRILFNGESAGSQTSLVAC